MSTVKQGFHWTLRYKPVNPLSLLIGLRIAKLLYNREVLAQKVCPKQKSCFVESHLNFSIPIYSSTFRGLVQLGGKRMR